MTDIERAYQVLGVPHSASVSVIKQAYRRIAKRWHPDLYPHGSLAHTEATFMMKVINQAYSQIEKAPLRHGLHRESWEQTMAPAAAHSTAVPPQCQSKSRWLERTMLFFGGAIFGLFLCLPLLLDFSGRRSSLWLICGGVALLSGVLAAVLGVRLWRGSPR